MSRRRFFVDRFHHGQAVIDGARAHHLRQVLRVQPGQTFELSDTRRLYLARVASATNAAVTFHLDSELPVPPPLPEVTLLAAIFKFDRFEWMLEKSTELGVTRIVPLIASRTGPGLAQSAAKRLDRWRRIVEESAQQSRRMAPPGIDSPADLASALHTAPPGSRWILDETLAGAPPPAAAPAVLLSGPEGGFTDAERAAAAALDFLPVSLGPLILRAETAPLAALAVALSNRRMSRK